MSKTTNKFSPEVRSRAVRLVLEHEHPSRWATILSIAPKIGCTGQTLNDWVNKAEVDSGKRPGASTDIRNFAPSLRAPAPARLRIGEMGMIEPSLTP
jgi:transposase-like protein